MIDKTSIRVPSQLPEFVRDDVNYETFVAFVQAYYEWMELPNAANAATTLVNTSNEGVTFGSKNILNYSDVDKTLDDFLAYYFNDFLPNFPEEILSDKTKVLKVAKQLYQAKGTPASYKLLFRVLYNSDAEILMTKDLVFRASDSQWYVPKYLKIKSNDTNWLLPSVKNLRLYGENSKSFAVIDNIVTTTNIDKFNLYVSQIERLFVSGEYIRVVDSNNQDVWFDDGVIVPKGTPNAYTLRAKIVGAISNITINNSNRGSKYKPGDPVVVYNGLDSAAGVGATAQVGETTSGSIQRLNVINPGYGYRVRPQSTISFVGGGTTPDHEARAHIQTIDPGKTTTANVAYDSLIPFINANTRINATNYGFNANPTANSSTKLKDAFSFITFDVGPIDSVIVDNGGGGYTDIPSITAQSLYQDIIGNENDLSVLGILAPIEIISSGFGYQVDDKVILTGGTGRGAYANVTSVSPAGHITGISYVNSYVNNDTYPLGGMGYTTTGLPSATVLSANTNAHGASVIVPAILGSDASFSAVTDRIGAITTITINSAGEDYVKTPNVSFRVQDLIVTNPTGDIGEVKPGTLIYQGIDIDNPEIDIFDYQASIDSVTVIKSTPSPATNIYQIRVYNYVGVIDITKPLYADVDPLSSYPVLNLSTYADAEGSFQDGIKIYGDGAAKGSAKFAQGLIFGQGRYLDTVGHPSSYSVLQSDINNDYTYILSVEKPIAEYRDLLKKLLHPAGARLIGRDILKNSKSFNLHGHRGQGLQHSIQYWLNYPVGDPYATVSMNVSSGSLSTNTVNVHTSGSSMLDSILPGDYLMIDYGAPFPISSTIKSVNASSNTITLQDQVWLTFPNVAYGWSNTIANALQVSDFNVSNTPNYNIVNNGEYSDANNHIRDIVFVGDNITIGANTYVVRKVDYGNHLIYIDNDIGLLSIDPTGDNIYTNQPTPNTILLGEHILSYGTKEHPLPFTINRVINTPNAYIRKLD
jgi:hypothetical protein